MTFDLVHIWAHMSLLSKGIAFSLLLMALASVGVFVERFLSFAKAASATRAFLADARLAFEAWELTKLIEVAKKHQSSPLAVLFDRLASKYLAVREHSGGVSPLELVRGEATRSLEATGAELRRGMNVLASVGSVAPFVGLLGTVVGIIAAFASIGKAGSAGIAAVSSGISEALIETAFGLMVAIPAVLFFNYLSSRVLGIEANVGRAVGEFLDEMEKNHGKKSAVRSEKAA
ncbi:MAG: tolQ protein [Sorangiineae bacterium NIC37A_2]|jgi:biopolymer transport protein ExbB|nr:MAG: tolQ protein [Sorangiineae bacterium NIC37A_2]